MVGREKVRLGMGKANCACRQGRSPLRRIHCVGFLSEAKCIGIGI